jgi:hypothetical protein
MGSQLIASHYELAVIKRFKAYKENACHFLPLQFAYI